VAVTSAPYFYLSVSEREVPEAELRAITSVASDKKAFSRQLQILIDDGKFKRFLERFEDYLSELSEEAAPIALVSLFDVGDRLPVHTERFLDINPQQHIARIASLLLKRNPSKERRAVIAKELANSCSGLTTLTGWVAIIEPEEKRDSEPSPLGEDLLELSDFMELREIVLNRIRSEDKKGTLSKRPLLGMILFRWRDWADISEPKGYASELVKTDEGLLDFLVGSVTVKLSTGVGKYTIRRTPEIRRKHISPFVDPQLLTSRVENIRDIKWGELSQEQKEAIDAFLHMTQQPSGSEANIP
jgi:predicted KAP-like P-loop ATPase